MKFTILTIGTRGDVQPFVALGKELVRKGHDVKIATHQKFESLILSNGLSFHPLAGNPDELFASEAGLRFLEPGRNPFSVFPRWFDVWDPFLEAIMVECWNATLGADALIGSATVPWAPDIALGRAIPFFHASLWPVFATKEFIPILVHPGVKAVKFTRALLHNLLGLQLWLRIRPTLNRVRKNTMSLPSAAVPTIARQNFEWVQGFTAVSPILVPKPKDWPNNIEITGPLILPSNEFKPSAELQAFLAAGDKPICIGFSSAVSRDPNRLIETIEAAVVKSARRAIFIGTKKIRRDGRNRSQILEIDFAPHDWLFPHAAAVVSAAGAGTTSDVLRAGIPHITIPFGAEQRFWADRVFRLGLGPEPLYPNELTVDQMSRALETVINNGQMQQRCREIGQKACAEDGVANAISYIEQRLNKRS